jgi:methyl-accepting chemotaxis protein
LWDMAGHLVLCNDRYLEMYGIPREVAKPGTAFMEIVRHRVATGSLQHPPAVYLSELTQALSDGKIMRFVTETPDGKAIFVESRAMPGNRYWIGTHDDVTERRSAEQKSAALSKQETLRRARVDQAIVDFRHSVEGVLQTVAGSVATMKSTASTLSTTSNETTTHTESAVRASGEAFSGVETASVAANELSKSIAEINLLLVSAADVTKTVAMEARSTNAAIAGLAEAARKIGNVVKLIQSVTAQTNLLALNATIEAARSGAAGKGFAVVASEVKTLAVTTAKATDDIIAQIATVQSSTQWAVQAVGGIAKRMEEVQQFTDAAAMAVAAQNNTTKDISSSVAAAASNTNSVVAVLDSVSDAIASMRKSSDTVLMSSRSVEIASDELRDSINGFLSKVAI